MRRRANQPSRNAQEQHVAGELARVSFTEVCSPACQKFAEAVTNPFGNGAIGATLPDQYQDVIIPLLDRLEMDFNLQSFQMEDSNWQTDTFVPGAYIQLTGVIFWIQPRCAESGIYSDCSRTVHLSRPRYPHFVNEKWSEFNKFSTLYAYNLCYAGIWNLSHGDTVEDGENIPFAGEACGLYRRYQLSSNDFLPTVHGFRMIPFDRYESLKDAVDSLRILGAGLKVWSEEAPINTGGFATAGWMTVNDVLSPFDEQRTSPSSSGVTSTYSGRSLAASNYVTKIKGISRQQGVDGVTVRYSPLQAPEQLDHEVSIVDQVSYNEYQYSTPFTGYYGLENAVGSSIQAFDLMLTGNYVPVVVWKYNVQPVTTPEEVTSEGIYSLRVMCIAHSEGVPRGTSPFMCAPNQMEMGIDNIKMILENWQDFPPATEGHSFKSFASKARKVIAKVSQGAGKVAKVLALIDKYAAMTASII
jgi:hypothetical protein